MKKNTYKSFIMGLSVLCAVGLGTTSCTDYLDKNPDTTVGETDAYKNFKNFQGFIEEIYNCIPDKEKKYWITTWNLGDDEILNTKGDWHMLHQVDLGNFWAWQAGKMGQDGFWFDDTDASSTSTDPFQHGLYAHAWYCIRKCNLGLENLNLLTEATTEEKNLIAGQLYFFRAWWHFEMMEYLGGLPYVDHTFASDETPQLPRLSYQECADKAAEDFRKAADLLPIDWDNTDAGKSTSGKNDLRVNKIAALGYLGKNYLWAGSPLMQNGAQTGGSMTYSYNEDYCKKAAEAFGELLSLVENGETQYALAEYNYKNIYDHEKASDASSCFSEIFYTYNQNWKQPGSVEAIFRGPSAGWSHTRWGFSRSFGPATAQKGDVTHCPTANYVDYAYGMANGLPLDDENSGWDKEHPFKDRDPRFYHDIMFDGQCFLNAASKSEQYKYLQLYTGGLNRAEDTDSRSGFFYQKLSPHTANEYDLMDDYVKANPHAYLPYMRLADIYLMYAEACAVTGGASGKSSNFSKTAEEAINTLRDRAGVGHVAAKFTTDKHKFMDEVRRERACELAFEGFRFNDLQRWLLLTESPWNEKTAIEFDRIEDDDWYTKNDAREARVANYRYTQLLKRDFTKKHYWFPLKVSDVSLYEGFDQNPGW